MQADLRYELAVRRSEELLSEARLARLARDARAARSNRRDPAASVRVQRLASFVDALLRGARPAALREARGTDEPLGRMTECAEC